MERDNSERASQSDNSATSLSDDLSNGAPTERDDNNNSIQQHTTSTDDKPQPTNSNNNNQAFSTTNGVVCLDCKKSFKNKWILKQHSTSCRTKSGGKAKKVRF